ncbi:Hint domain-containing protein [Paracoccus sp. DMF-8]|uniref:Hint domain-containing protein n=1 Tax=Paracoccus sp. DMF-8 TaxID=3019445 RepID=UPI0023E879DF|nr:Hint domain-containing protein [Paracoccus sp. DMF-8]MDF3604790.1 Hint domain-containing protein [Paracoccus sp. DMF-8]
MTGSHHSGHHHSGKDHGNNHHGGNHHNGNHCGPTAPGCENMIFIGKLADMDPNELHPGAEKAASILGGTSFGDPSNPLFGNMVEVTLNDSNNDGIIRTNDGLAGFFSETITHDASGSARNYKVDLTTLVHKTTVTFQNPDGTTEDVVLTVRIMQDTAGNTFLMPPPLNASEAEIEAMTSRPIVGVQFPQGNKHYDTCHDSIFTDRTCFPCFAADTLIETEFGAMPIQDLRQGMKVWTRDNGLQEIRWIGSRKLPRTVLERADNLRPIRIRAGSLGRDIPARDLVVSPQHRILVRSRIAQKIFGCEEVLVAAKQLLQIEGIDVATDLESVEYFHMLFDRHEIVVSDGAETESLYTGAEALKSLGQAAREEIFAIFPELRRMSSDGPTPEGARVLASGRLGRKLAVRHVQNDKVLVRAAK